MQVINRRLVFQRALVLSLDLPLWKRFIEDRVCFLGLYKFGLMVHVDTARLNMKIVLVPFIGLALLLVDDRASLLTDILLLVCDGSNVS